MAKCEKSCCSRKCTVKVIYFSIYIISIVGLATWLGLFHNWSGKDALELASDFQTIKNINITFIIVITTTTIGFILFVVCIVKCCRDKAENENRSGKCETFWTYVHVGIIVTAIIIQIVCGIVLVFNQCRIEYHMAEHLQETLNNKNLKPNWDTVQSENICCGIYGPKDYINSTLYNASGVYVPMTCCVLNNDKEIKNETLCQDEARQLQDDPNLITTFVKSEGCYKTILNDIREYIQCFQKLAYAFGGVEGGILLFICCIIACM